MTTCKTCSKEVAKLASTCPNCGAKLKKSIVEKILILLGIFFAISIIYIIFTSPVNFKASSSSNTSKPTPDATERNQRSEGHDSLPTKNVVVSTELMNNYINDHGYHISNETGGGNLAGTQLLLPNSFDAVINGVKIGELLREKNEQSKLNGLDFSKYLGQKVSIFTWGLDATADAPYGINVFFVIFNDEIVGVWYEPNKYGEKVMTLSIFENL